MPRHTPLVREVHLRQDRCPNQHPSQIASSTTTLDRRGNRIPQVPLQNVNHDDVSTTTVDLEDPVDVKFLDVTLNIYGVCTTMKRVRLLPLRPVNDYFPRRF